MKPVNNRSVSVNGLFNNQQNVVEKVSMNNYLKTITLVITLSVATIFSKTIQNTLVSNYNKSVAFMQKYNSNGVLLLGV